MFKIKTRILLTQGIHIIVHNFNNILLTKNPTNENCLKRRTQNCEIWAKFLSFYLTFNLNVYKLFINFCKRQQVLLFDTSLDVTHKKAFFSSNIWYLGSAILDFLWHHSPYHNRRINTYLSKSVYLLRLKGVNPDVYIHREMKLYHPGCKVRQVEMVFTC